MFDLTLIYHIVHGLGALDFSHCVQLQYSWASDEMKQFSRVNSLIVVLMHGIVLVAILYKICVVSVCL